MEKDTFSSDENIDYSYAVDYELQISDIKTIFNKTHISSISIINNFIKYRYPAILINLVLKTTDFIELRKKYTFNKPLLKNINLSLFAKKIYDKTSKENETSSDPDVFERFRSYYNMVGIIDTSTYFSDEDIELYNLKEKDTNTGNPSKEEGIKVRISLFDGEALSAFSRGSSNFISSNSNIDTIVAKLFIDCALPSLKLVASPSIDVSVKETFVMPLKGFYDGLNYINERYSLFDSGNYNIYIKDKMVYLYPIFEKLDIELGDETYDRNIHINVTNANTVRFSEEYLGMKNGTYIFNISRDVVSNIPNFNLIKNKSVIITADGSMINTDTSKDEFIHSINVLSSPNSVNPIKKYKPVTLTVPLTKCHPALDLNPHSKVTLSSSEFKGEYRCSVFSEMYSSRGVEKAITFFI